MDLIRESLETLEICADAVGSLNGPFCKRCAPLRGCLGRDEGIAVQRTALNPSCLLGRGDVTKYLSSNVTALK